MTEKSVSRVDTFAESVYKCVLDDLPNESELYSASMYVCVYAFDLEYTKNVARARYGERRAAPNRTRLHG